MPSSPYILSCDWGTSSFRLRVARVEDGCVLAEQRSSDGISALAAVSDFADASARDGRFSDVLERGIECLAGRCSVSLSDAPVVISGMASSSIGWRAQPYASLPFDLREPGRSAIVEAFVIGSAARRIELVSGVRSAHDVMRGEETELIGLAHAHEAASDLMANGRPRCCVILPGTHSKHAMIAGGKLVDFTTCMTGELFAVLAGHSVLRHSVDVSSESAASFEDAGIQNAFNDGVDQSLPGDLSHVLFRVRTRQLLEGIAPPQNRAFLSGLLIGAEVGALARRIGTDGPIILCAGPAVARQYQLALGRAGLLARTTVVPADEVDLLSVQGHAVIARACSEAREASRRS